MIQKTIATATTTTTKGGTVLKGKFIVMMEKFIDGQDPSEMCSTKEALWDELFLLEPRGDWIESTLSQILLRSNSSSSPPPPPTTLSSVDKEMKELSSWVPKVLNACSEVSGKQGFGGGESCLDGIRARNALVLARHIIRGVVVSDYSTTIKLTPFEILSYVCLNPENVLKIIGALISNCKTLISHSNEPLQTRSAASAFLLSIVCLISDPRRNQLCELFLNDSAAINNSTGDGFISTLIEASVSDLYQVTNSSCILAGILCSISPNSIPRAVVSLLSRDMLGSVSDIVSLELNSSVNQLLSQPSNESQQPNGTWMSKLVLSFGSASMFCRVQNSATSIALSKAISISLRSVSPLILIREVCRVSPTFCSLLLSSTPASNNNNNNNNNNSTKQLLRKTIPILSEVASLFFIASCECKDRHQFATLDSSMKAFDDEEMDSVIGISHLYLDTFLAIASSSPEAISDFDIVFDSMIFEINGPISSPGSFQRIPFRGCFVDLVIVLCSGILKRTLHSGLLSICNSAISLVQWLLLSCSFTEGADPRIHAPWKSLWNGLFHLIRFLSRLVIPGGLLSQQNQQQGKLKAMDILTTSIRVLDLLAVSLVHGERFADAESVDELWYEFGRNSDNILRLCQFCSTTSTHSSGGGDGGWKTSILMNAITQHVSNSISAIIKETKTNTTTTTTTTTTMNEFDMLTPEIVRQATHIARRGVQIDSDLAPLVPASHSSIETIKPGEGKFYNAVINIAVKFARKILKPDSQSHPIIISN